MNPIIKKMLTITFVLLWSGCPAEAKYQPRHPPYAPPHRWCMRSDETLKSALERWSQQAGWVVRWQSTYDYPIDAPTCLTGCFVKVLEMISQGYQQAEQPLYFHLYPSQHLLVIAQR